MLLTVKVTIYIIQQDSSLWLEMESTYNITFDQSDFVKLQTTLPSKNEKRVNNPRVCLWRPTFVFQPPLFHLIVFLLSSQKSFYFFRPFFPPSRKKALKSRKFFDGKNEKSTSGTHLSSEERLKMSPGNYSGGGDISDFSRLCFINSSGTFLSLR